MSGRALLLLAAAALLACSGEAPPPEARFFCRGNEPFWNVELDGERAVYDALGLEDGPWELAGTLSASPQVIRFEGTRAGSDAGFGLAVFPERCADTMSDEQFSHRAELTLPDGATLRGCCEIGGRPSSPGEVGSVDLAALPVATLEGRDDWPRLLLELHPAIERCLAETGGSSLHVMRAWPMDRGFVGVITGNGEGGAFDCVATADGTALDRIGPVTEPVRRPGETPVFFSPAAQGPLSGECWSHERVLDETGALVGFLSTDTC